jgi:hypothetical protein
MHHMTHNRAGRVLLFVLFAAIFIVVFGFAVMSLWNWLMPALFGLPPITYWQGLGLLVLSWLLFGGRRGFGHGGWHGRWREKWEKMTPEQRADFRKAMEARCGHRRQEAPPSADAQ